MSQGKHIWVSLASKPCNNGQMSLTSTKRAQTLHALPAHPTLALLFEGLLFKDVGLALPRLENTNTTLKKKKEVFFDPQLKLLFQSPSDILYFLSLVHYFCK